MWSRINGFCGLLILTCCFIVACLFYVELCRDLGQAVKNPFRSEYWQVRTVATQLRNPVVEAQENFEKGDYTIYQLANGGVTKAIPGFTHNLARADMLSFSAATDVPDKPVDAKENFTEVQNEFAVRYNREMKRLIKIFR